jgi:hypothetical protein
MLDCRHRTTTWHVTSPTLHRLAGVVCSRCSAQDWSLVNALRV